MPGIRSFFQIKIYFQKPMLFGVFRIFGNLLSEGCIVHLQMYAFSEKNFGQPFFIASFRGGGALGGPSV